MLSTCRSERIRGDESREYKTEPGTVVSVHEPEVRSDECWGSGNRREDQDRADAHKICVDGIISVNHSMQGAWR